MTTFEGKICIFYMTSKKYRFIFLITRFLPIFVNKKKFFKHM